MTSRPATLGEPSHEMAIPPGPSGGPAWCDRASGSRPALPTGGLLEFEGRSVAVLVGEPLVAEPIDVAQCGDLDLISCASQPARIDQLVLVKADEGPGCGIVLGAANGADRRCGADAGRSLAKPIEVH